MHIYNIINLLASASTLAIPNLTFQLFAVMYIHHNLQ